MKTIKLLKQRLAPEGIYSFSKDIRACLQSVSESLPKKSDVSEQQCRYPKSLEDMAAFMDTFFARHFFQSQDTLLHNQVFCKTLTALKERKLTLADIGSGPAVSSLATMDILAQLHQMGLTPPIRIKILLDDSESICIKTGKRLLQQFFQKHRDCFLQPSIECSDIPFPKSLSVIRRFAIRNGGLDLAFLSYVLAPLKENLKHKDLADSIRSLKLLTSANSNIIILQDRFHESLIRTLGNNLNATTRKGSFTQTVYSKDNSNSVHTYTYYRTVVS